MASLINPPLLDKTGKEIVAELTGEAVQPSASQINAPISDATGKAILEAIKQGGGGGGGANVLTLYVEMKGETLWAYKDPECTEEYESYVEAKNAVDNADCIKFITPNNKVYMPVVVATGIGEVVATMIEVVDLEETVFNAFLYTDSPK